ncbi:MAG: AMP-binding protein, partial [Bacteroidales bacterium]|nr:AMP-binding protein [Bacteroidales bacterium]
MTITRTFDLLELYRTQYKMEDSFAGKVNGKWEKLSSAEYIRQVNDFSCGLLSLGFSPGDKIAIISNNRPEWNVADMGMAQIGVVSVPIYPTSSFDDFLYILRHSAPRVILVSGKILYEKLKHLVQDTPDIERIYTFNKVTDAQHWSE